MVSASVQVMLDRCAGVLWWCSAFGLGFAAVVVLWYYTVTLSVVWKQRWMSSNKKVLW
jgi:hypothetical protein